MTTTIQVMRGLCSPMRDDVLTALNPYGIKILDFDCWGEGHYYLPVPPFTRMLDSDIWVLMHRARITVSDEQAAWAERLLWQSGKVWLTSPPLNPKLVWTAPPACKVGEHGTLGRGDMPTPWSAKKKSGTPAKPSLLTRIFGTTPQPTRPQRTTRRAPRPRRQRR